MLHDNKFYDGVVLVALEVLVAPEIRVILVAPKTTNATEW
jgi:hypothetical protein